VPSGAERLGTGGAARDTETSERLLCESASLCGGRQRCGLVDAVGRGEIEGIIKKQNHGRRSERD
jgi:hypothetical protein